MQDQRKAILAALGWWFIRREIRRRVAGNSGRGLFGRLIGAVIVVGAIAGGLVAWRRFGGGSGDGGGGAPLEPSPEPAPRAPAVV